MNAIPKDLFFINRTNELQIKYQLGVAQRWDCKYEFSPRIFKVLFRVVRTPEENKNQLITVNYNLN